MDQAIKLPQAAQGYFVEGLEKTDRTVSRETRLRPVGVLKLFFYFYKFVFGPTLHILGGWGFGCRYHPTCSHYCLQCFQTQSFAKALQLSLIRIINCNPWMKRDYYYPVPDATKKNNFIKRIHS